MKFGEPKVWGAMVLTSGLVLCGVGIWQLTGPLKYRATAKVRVERDSSEAGASRANPYFVPEEAEAMQSSGILGKVVEVLHLDEEWGRKLSAGGRLERDRAVAMLRRQVDVRPIPDTFFAEVRAFSDNPVEAAQIANAIANAYRDQKLAQRQQSRERHIDDLEKELRGYESRIKSAQELVEQLKASLNVPVPEPNELILEQNYPPVWKAKLALQEAEKARDRWVLEFATNRSEVAEASFDTLFTDEATPPKTPISPNPPLGISLLVAGVSAVLGGTLLLKSRKIQNPAPPSYRSTSPRAPR